MSRTDSNVYHDNGRAFGRRTRVFRNGANGGVEWMYAVDWVGGDTRWYEFMSLGVLTNIKELIDGGMFLSRFEDGPWSATA